MTTTVAAFLVWVPVASAWSWPVQGPVLEPFSYDESHPYAAGQHRGIDIGANATGDPVVAPEGGTVSFAGFVPTSGESLTIETADGYSVTLTHLGSIDVAEGATVAEGAAVATVGPSGTPEHSVPYVHLGVRLGSDPLGYVDPLGFLPAPAPAPPAPTPAPTPAPKPVHQPVPMRARPRGGGLVVENPAAAPTPVVVTPAQPVHAAKPSPKPQPHPARPATQAHADAPRIRRPVVEPLIDPLVKPLWGGAPLAAEPHAQAQEAEPLVLSVGPGIVAALLALVTAFTQRRRRTPLPARVIAFRKEQRLRRAA